MIVFNLFILINAYMDLKKIIFFYYLYFFIYITKHVIASEIFIFPAQKSKLRQ